MYIKNLKLSVISTIVLGTTSFACLANNISTINTQSESSSPQLIITENSNDKQAKLWGLNKKQWEDYSTIMKDTDAGHFYKDIDPVSVLGVYSDSESQRIYYANLYVDNELKRLQRVRQFDNLVNHVINDRQPSLMLFKSTEERLASKLPASMQNTNTLKLVQTLLFIDAKNCDKACNKFASDLVHSSGPFSILDIYFVNTNNKDSVIRGLASDWGITRKQITSYQVTINHDSGQYQQSAINNPRSRPLPFALRETPYGTTTIGPDNSGS